MKKMLAYRELFQAKSSINITCYLLACLLVYLYTWQYCFISRATKATCTPLSNQNSNCDWKKPSFTYWDFTSPKKTNSLFTIWFYPVISGEPDIQILYGVIIICIIGRAVMMETDWYDGTENLFWYVRRKNKDSCKLNLRTNATAFRVWERAEKMRIKQSANSEKGYCARKNTLSSSTFSTTLYKMQAE